MAVNIVEMGENGGISKARRNRLRKLLPDLKLKYPNDAEMRKLSDLIGTTDPRLADSIKSIILDAHLNEMTGLELQASHEHDCCEMPNRQDPPPWGHLSRKFYN